MFYGVIRESGNKDYICYNTAKNILGNKVQILADRNESKEKIDDYKTTVANEVGIINKNKDTIINSWIKHYSSKVKDVSKDNFFISECLYYPDGGFYFLDVYCKSNEKKWKVMSDTSVLIKVTGDSISITCNDQDHYKLPIG